MRAPYLTRKMQFKVSFPGKLFLDPTLIPVSYFSIFTFSPLDIFKVLKVS
jgi:hypothetical protein